MKANVIEGSISFSLIVLNASELGSIESALEAVCADEIFEFLRQKIMVSKFEVIQESKEGSSLPFMLNQQTRCQDNILLTQKFRKFLKP
jgi:hypothetical protein